MNKARKEIKITKNENEKAWKSRSFPPVSHTGSGEVKKGGCWDSPHSYGPSPPRRGLTNAIGVVCKTHPHQGVACKLPLAYIILRA